MIDQLFTEKIEKAYHIKSGSYRPMLSLSPILLHVQLILNFSAIREVKNVSQYFFSLPHLLFSLIIGWLYMLGVVKDTICSCLGLC